MSNKHPVVLIFFTNLKIVDDAVSWIPEYLQQTFFYTIYMILFFT
jgi:hypothetical protein